MADIVQIPNSTGTAKIRKPWAVVVLALVTIGIYYIFWWYFVNREMRDLGRANNTDLGQRPGISVLAVTLGALIIIPPFVSIWQTGRRMEGAQRVTGTSGGSGPIFFLLHLVPLISIFAPLYFQDELNKAWRSL
jgi:Domain of unknown function (DUF4234)